MTHTPIILFSAKVMLKYLNSLAAKGAHLVKITNNVFTIDEIGEGVMIEPANGSIDWEGLIHYSQFQKLRKILELVEEQPVCIKLDGYMEIKGLLI
ncbi:hypothetical protein MUK70_11695 [Dyadobacter chenwenxiniae]|uniref:Uncharacterized protein n=1 Tax=Dyadobacter chenwenxiniae TaxID=2906456 RepID=A0A9X1TCN9_9BACT|nr:hypothetical protein [Dyadobacter chenwenxiniae]MCF0059904.1 hypothetical protein [Dyadobacter chenwenxiniae]UON85643.1 hypothetical protein MUK70_11695 [Dyadobacter chenwenxiniae]